MFAFDPALSSQLPVIRQIIADETWLEGERRGCRVSADDPVVRENVCRVILRVGQELRDAANRQAAGARPAGVVVSLPDQSRAA